jgi:hypothetical protein
MLTLAAVFAAIGVLGRNPMLPPRLLTHARVRPPAFAQLHCPASPFGGGPVTPLPPGALLVGRAGNSAVYRLKDGGYRIFHRRITLPNDGGPLRRARPPAITRNRNR